MSDAPTRADDAIAVAPAPNWYGSSLADWGGAGGSLCAYAARNVVVLVRPRDARAHRGRPRRARQPRDGGRVRARPGGGPPPRLRLRGQAPARVGHLRAQVSERPPRPRRGGERRGDVSSPRRRRIVVVRRRRRAVLRLHRPPRRRLGVAPRTDPGGGRPPAPPLRRPRRHPDARDRDRGPLFRRRRFPRSRVVCHDVAVAQRSGALALFAFAPSADSPGSPLEPTRLPRGPRRCTSSRGSRRSTTRRRAPRENNRRGPGSRARRRERRARGSVTLWTWDGAKTAPPRSRSRDRTSARATTARTARSRGSPSRGRSHLRSRPGPGPASRRCSSRATAASSCAGASTPPRSSRESLLGREQRDSASAPLDASAFERFHGAHDKAVFAVAPDPTGASVFTASHETFASRTSRRSRSVARRRPRRVRVRARPRPVLGARRDRMRRRLGAGLAEGGSEPERADGGYSPGRGLTLPGRGLTLPGRGLSVAGPREREGDVRGVGASGRGRALAGAARGVRRGARGRPRRRRRRREGGGGAAPRYAAQKDGHAGGVLALRWSEAEAGDGERGRSGLDPTGGRSYDLVSLGGDGRVWRWTALAAPAGSGAPRGTFAELSLRNGGGGPRRDPRRGRGVRRRDHAFPRPRHRRGDVARLRDGHHRARGGSRRRPAPGGVRRARVERRVRLRAPTREPRIYPRRWWVEPRGFETAGRVARS